MIHERGVEVQCRECGHRRVLRMILSGCDVSLHIWLCAICSEQNATAYAPPAGSFRATDVYQAMPPFYED